MGTPRVRGRYGQAHTVPPSRLVGPMEAYPMGEPILDGTARSRVWGTDLCAPPRVSSVLLSKGPINRSLARMVGVLNRLLAALFLVGGPIVGATIGAHYGFHVVREAVIGFLVGLVAGAFLAVVVCGLLALTCPFTTRSTTSTACWERRPRAPQTGTPHQIRFCFRQ